MEWGTIYPRIITLTRRELGMRINPHMFRDCAATSIALKDPEHVRITMHILGHSTMRTSERHYNHPRANRALQRHQDNVLRLRGEDVAPPGRRGPRSGRS
jgi:integrase